MAAAAPDVDAEAGVAAEAGGVSFAGEDTLLALFFECLALMGGTNGENFRAGCKHRGERDQVELRSFRALNVAV